MPALIALVIMIAVFGLHSNVLIGRVDQRFDSLNVKLEQIQAFVLRALDSREISRGSSNSLGEPADARDRATPAVKGGEVSAREIEHPTISPIMRLGGMHCEEKGVFVEQWGKSAVVVEVGAFIGEDVHYFKGAKKLYSFEPTPDKQSMIRQRITELGMDAMVELHMAAATDFTGTIELFIDSSNSKGSQQDTVGVPPPWLKDNDRSSLNSVKVPAYRLDTPGLLKEHVHMLKIDTQGHELKVLKGAEGLLSAPRPIEVLHFEFSPALMRNAGDDPSELLRYVTSFGYMCFDCDMFTRVSSTSSLRGVEDYEKNFKAWNFKGANAGQWGDLVCLH